MSDSEGESMEAGPIDLGPWDRFWFQPASVASVAKVRGLLCLLTAAFFFSSWRDMGDWYGEAGPLSSSQVASFLKTAGLEDEARWLVSPLFLTDSMLVYQAYLLAGVILAGFVAVGRGGRVAGWALWLMLVGWANRTMILSGMVETLLSLSLFAVAIAPPLPLFGNRENETNKEEDWTAGFANRLLAVQITIVALATFATMLAGRVWWNGLGAYALAAPALDRTIDWTELGLYNTLVHESLTHLMVIALPLGLLLAWCPATRRMGQAVLIAWCATIALLGSLWLYAATFAVMVLTIGNRKATAPE